MSQSVLYQWLSPKDRLKVKLFFYQTLNEFLNVLAKQEYRNIIRDSFCKPSVHGNIFHNCEKTQDDLGEIAFDLVCKEAGIHRHSAKWDELLQSANKKEYSLYKAIGKGVAIICKNRASKQEGLPFVSAYDYEQFAEQFYQKISIFDKNLKIYAYVNKKCLKIHKRLSELNTYAESVNTTSNGGFDKVPPTRVCTYDFRQTQKGSLIKQITLLFKNMKVRK